MNYQHYKVRPTTSSINRNISYYKKKTNQISIVDLNPNYYFPNINDNRKFKNRRNILSRENILKNNISTINFSTVYVNNNEKKN